MQGLKAKKTANGLKKVNLMLWGVSTTYLKNIYFVNIVIARRVYSAAHNIDDVLVPDIPIHP